MPTCSELMEYHFYYVLIAGDRESRETCIPSQCCISKGVKHKLAFHENMCRNDDYLSVNKGHMLIQAVVTIKLSQ